MERDIDTAVAAIGGNEEGDNALLAQAQSGGESSYTSSKRRVR